MGDGEGEKVEPGTTLCVTEGVGVVAEPANNAGLGTNQINTDQIMATMVQSVAMPMSHGWERPFINFFITVVSLPIMHNLQKHNMSEYTQFYVTRQGI
ncbi:hypothetical protein KSC_000080 [Ktedonobacter sp. SOSP1-52]|nr:hypothetical protein KSC_000080 [Ktedonobacter sp. SOSP1-52]